jgi:bifunctional isochorismate lyase/aryl carrier protein
MAIPKIQSYALPTKAEYPTNKVDWPFQADRAALLIHDMQSYFVGFYGDDSPLMREVINNIARLKQYAKQNKIPVFYTAQPAEQDPADRALLNDMWGPGLTRFPNEQPIIDRIAPEANDVVLTKWRYSAFHRSDLEEQLKHAGRDQLIICGVYAHIGVMISATDAFMRDIKPFLIGDAVADFSAQEHTMALDYVAGRCGCVLSTEALIDRDIQPATWSSYDHFKQQIIALLDDVDDEFDADESLLDYGLDSVQVMQLIAQWNQSGLSVSFVELAKNPSVNGWWRLISERLPLAVAS